MSFITTSTFDSWDEPIVFFVLRMPCQYLPYAFLFLSLILDGPQAAMIQATGLAAAHLYNLMTGLYPNFGIQRNLITTPGFMMKIFGTQDVVHRPYGTAVPGVAGQAAWGLDLSWKRFGPGRTLGGAGSGTTRQRPKGWVLASMVMVGFLAFCCFLGFLFVMYGAPQGWLSGIEGSANSVSQAEVGGAAAGAPKSLST
jgi:Derlin-2/3